jgi:hypothetical protein
VRTEALSLSSLFFVALSACGGDDLGTSDPQEFTAFTCSSKQVTPGNPRVYFSPWDEAELEALCLLDQAKDEVVVGHYNIRTQSYLDKLVELHERGVDVKVVVDLNNSKREWNVGDDFLEQSGVPLVRTSSKKGALMHLKSTVIDRRWIMTGSFNWNETASLANDENMLVLQEPALAELYAAQILQVFDKTTPVVQGGIVDEHYEVHWSPEERLDTLLAKRIDATTSSLDVAMFTLTSDTVGKAIERALDRQVSVRVVTELKQAGLSQVDDRIEQKGGLVVRAANRVGEFSAMHQKYAILDGETVITGATNWTNAGTRTNDEDLLILSGLPDVAEAYRRNFADLLWVYAELEAGDLPTSSRAGVLFQAVHDGTAFGDSMVVVGNRPELGGWSPQSGIPLETTDTLFPSWSGNVKLPAGTAIEFKFVTIRANGAIVWEPGPNRVLTIGDDGRSEVYGGTYGDTSDAWTPAAP